MKDFKVFDFRFGFLVKSCISDWFICYFFREELQGSVLDRFSLFSEQFSVNFPDDVSRKTRAPNV